MMDNFVVGENKNRMFYKIRTSTQNAGKHRIDIEMELKRINF